MKTIIRVNFDASCDNNSKFKFMGIGIAVFVNEEYREDLSIMEMYGTNGTNNIAEWRGLELALEHCSKLVETYPEASISIYGDSQLVVRQFNGIYRIKQENFKPFFRSCKKLVSGDIGKHIKRVEWIPREQNKEADRLSKKVVSEFIEENNMI